MSPAGAHTEAEQVVRDALAEVYAYLRAIGRRAQEVAASDTVPADHRRPLEAGARPQTHEATPSPTKSRRRFEEDDCETITTDV